MYNYLCSCFAGCAIRVVVRATQLDLMLVLKPEYSQNTNVKGLMGNLNNDPNDDLMRPDGTTLSPNSTRSVIHSEFGDKCTFVLLYMVLQFYSLLVKWLRDQDLMEAIVSPQVLKSVKFHKFLYDTWNHEWHYLLRLCILIKTFCRPPLWYSKFNSIQNSEFIIHATFNPLTAKLFNLNFHPLEVVSLWRHPQLRVSENYTDLTKWRSTLF